MENAPLILFQQHTTPSGILCGACHTCTAEFLFPLPSMLSYLPSAHAKKFSELNFRKPQITCWKVCMLPRVAYIDSQMGDYSIGKWNLPGFSCINSLFLQLVLVTDSSILLPLADVQLKIKFLQLLGILCLFTQTLYTCSDFPNQQSWYHLPSKDIAFRNCEFTKFFFLQKKKNLILNN